jgi:hypothetical protein
MILQSVITCPHCGTATQEPMPTDACRFFYECTRCGAELPPKVGKCCVFCCYGSVPCPPVQRVREAAAYCGLSAPFREVTFCASYKCHCFGVKGSRLSWFRG